MIFTNSSGNIQPYKSWKGESTFSSIPKWSKPVSSNNITTNNGVAFKARPIKHWRKQLYPTENTGSGRTSTKITFDRPGSTNYLGVTSDCNCLGISSNYLTVNIPNTKNNIIENSSYVVGPNKNRVCIGCSPEKNVIKSGRTEKLINPVSSTTAPKQKYNFSTKSYLRSKCALYEQRLTGSRVDGIQYIIPGTSTPSQPSDTDVGSQIRNSLDCSSKCNNTPVKIIYKPSNSQYGLEGAVSSSSRIQRLKMNTINKNGASFSTAWGAAATNAGKYTSNGKAPYFIKSKNNICNKSLYHINGNKNVCVNM